MKLTLLIIASVLSASCCCLQAREAPAPHDLEYRPEQKFAETSQMEVWNNYGEKLGTIKFMTADLENGRLVEVVVTSGGFLGMGARTTAVPPRALTYDAAKHVMRLDVTTEKFNHAPKFDKSHMAASTQRERVAEVNRYFGLEPWFFTEVQVVKKNAQILKLGYVHRTDGILGLPIRNVQGEFVGKVETLMTDLPKGQVIHVVVRTGAHGSPLSIIQPRALRFNERRNGLVLDNTLAEMSGEPRLKWTSGSNTAFQQEQYVNREVQADKGLHSKQSVQDGIVRYAIPMEQGKSFRDVQKTSRILQAIQADPSLSAHAKNVEVVTLNAQTTLRGHVNTPEGKRRIGEIAAKAGRPENVSNLIEIRPE
jgi:sporulation protein YlmC with PRC-barrel domain